MGREKLSQLHDFIMIRSESEFLKFALIRYDNPHLASLSEFESDLKRFTYLNNLLNRYRTDPLDLNGRLILNHIVILSNCFTTTGAVEMLKYKILPENLALLDTFLFFLNLITSTTHKLDFYLLDLLNEY
jgi:hypothetical protein